MSLKADLHIHSNHSDGRSSVREILETAIAKGLKAISITDHDNINGSLEAIEIVKEEHLPIVVIRGVEISTAQGHLLAYGINRDVDKGIDLVEAVKIVKKLGGITSLAHPFQFYRQGACRLRYFKVVDCIEVFNARSLPIFNSLSNFFRRKYGKGITAGSDAHKAEFVGSGVVMLEKASDEKLIMNALKNGQCIVEGEISIKNVFWRIVK
ncbi:PHP domain-containing protein [Archaeoglobus profundus]|uniref:PHP domain protein n=1 Tax=Archaeoglobus profundus (strain DSM 5631 / JCM 9629 / NBRC 100127 / Av18) TaxID=572546 RepID=D2REX1_ARCPA|nr:CehA/McbA family metallohydrolase [Archaeoglobus profundus]ADB58665.1 PHP domain protein [Archaeoglobus profundus DSM 5631]